MTPSPATSKNKASATALSSEKPKFLLTVNFEPTSAASETPKASDTSKSSQCSSLTDGESFECFGENDQMTSQADMPNTSEETVNDKEEGVDLDLLPQFQRDAEKNSISRHAWARTSLRGLRGSMKRQLGSNVLANHLYRSSSFNSSGRSSNCDTTEDMYSDVSLEDVPDLSHKLEQLQQQITNLADTQMSGTNRAKTENAVLQTKYEMLEEQLRDTEARAEERLMDEQKRYRELLVRAERESELRNENYQFRIQTMENESKALRVELQRLRVQCDKQSAELSQSEEKLESARFNLMVSQENLAEARVHEKRYLEDKNQSEQLIMELHKEIERIRTETQTVMATVKGMSNGFHNSRSSSVDEVDDSSEMSRIEELQNELEIAKQQNRELHETTEELQAMLLNKNIEEGRNLINGGLMSNLADELKEMGQSQDEALMNSLTQLQQAYQDKDDECRRLKRYIEKILLNICTLGHLELLEVKPPS